VDIIRKVDLTMNENLKYEVIKKLVEKNGNKKRAAVELNCTVRHINRMIKGYKETGKKFFVHGNLFLKSFLLSRSDISNFIMLTSIH
jgi:hypothetical protein